MVIMGVWCWCANASSGAHNSDDDCVVVFVEMSVETGKAWWDRSSDDCNSGRQ
jgi:hypothetical protein